MYALDISEHPLNEIRKRVPEFPSDQLLCADFFDCEMKFDIIIEQTFFCAINPVLRLNYVEQCFKLLEEKGMLTGLFFDAELYSDHPPYGGSTDEYTKLFTPYFKEISMKEESLSDPDRLGREIWVEMRKRDAKINS